MLMLFYSLVAGYFVLFDFTIETYDSISLVLARNRLEYHDMKTIGITSVLAAFCLTLTKFSVFHLKLVMKNSTTIESLESNYNSCYSISLYRNFLQVFGRNPWMWMLPLYGRSGKPAGDGIIWPMIENQYSDSDVNVESEANRELSIKPMNPFNSPDAWPVERNTESPLLHIKKSPSEVETDISIIKPKL